MLLTIDIGNTNIVFVIYEDRTAPPLLESRADTNHRRCRDEYAIFLSQILKLRGIEPEGIDGVAISSVVPAVTGPVTAAVELLFTRVKKPVIVGPGVRNGLNLRIDEPASIGGDLVCAAVAAKDKYPQPAIILDLGTVTKLLVLNKSAEFLGGALFPGVRISLESLANSTALLPMVSDGSPKKAINSDTAECMRAGLALGMASMLDGMIERFEAELGSSAVIVATGGHALSVVPYCKREIIYDQFLVSDGLRIIYYKNS